MTVNYRKMLRTVAALIIFIGLAEVFCLSARAASVRHYIARRTTEQNKGTADWSVVTGTAGVNTTASANGWIAGTNFTIGERYLLLVWGYHNSSNANNRSGIRITQGGVAIAESETTEETDRTSALYKTPYFWFTVWTAVNEDIEVEYYNDSASFTGRVDDITLLMINAESLIANNSLFYTIDNTGGALTTTFVPKATLNWTPDNNGDTWWVMAYTRGDIQIVDSDAYSARLNINGTARSTQITDGEDTNDTPIYGLGWAQTFTNAAQTVDVEIREVVGNQDWLSAGVFALRLNFFDEFQINTTAGTQDLNAGNNAYNQIATINETAQGPTSQWLVAAGCIFDDNDARTTARLQRDNTTNITGEYGGWQHLTTDEIPFTAADVDMYGNQQNFTIDFDARETNNTTDPDADDTWMVLFELGPIRLRDIRIYGD